MISSSKHTAASQGVRWLAAGGFRRGWAFLVFAAPGAFFLLAWLLAHARQQSAA